MPTVDIISTLPDEILCHILSFLPTQNAIATTFLSKRWSSLWLSVPTLHFDDETYLINGKPYSSFDDETYLINDNPYFSFDKFVRRAILARDLIKSFHLKCCVFSEYDLSDSDVNDWVNAAMQRGVEILDINLPYDPQHMMSLPFRVFSCRTLVVLKLIGWIYVDTFPAVVDFPSLKTLLLDVVDFIEPQCFMEFLGGCPNLEVLEAKNIFYLFRTNSSYGKGEFSLAKLVRGNIYNFQISFPLKAICNAEFLRVDKGAGVVPVFPNLTHIELVSDGDIDWRFVLAMLKKCPQLQILVLDKLKCLKASTDVVCSYPTLVPQCLSLHLKKCTITNYEGTENELHFAKYIMDNSMSLQAMTINILPSLSPEEKLEMKRELTLCSRRSATCKLSFK